MSRKVSMRPNQVHVFSISGSDFAYDSATGSLLKLDRVGRALVDYCIEQELDLLSFSSAEEERAEMDRAVCLLSPEFSPNDIQDAWDEIRSQSGKTIWGRDDVFGEHGVLKPGSDDKLLHLPTPKAMCLNVAHDCNLVCRYCFASQGRFGGNPMLMSPETSKKAIDFLVDASGNRRYLDVDFFGGEPLLCFDTVKQTVLYAAEKAKKHDKVFRFTITTNCTLLTRDIIDFLNEWRISAILSLDGRPETHNRMRRYRDGGTSHDDALKNALSLVESRGGSDYYVRGTYTKYNLDFYNDVKYLYDIGFRKISLEPAIGVDTDWAISESDLPALEESYLRLTDFWEECYRSKDPLDFYHFEIGLTHGVCKERRITGCGAGYEYLAVTPTGEIYPCHQLVGQEEFAMGYIHEPWGGGKVEESGKREELARRFFLSRVPNKPKCMDCWARYLCGGGCHAGSLGATGSTLDPVPLSCSIMKLRLEFALYIQYLKVMQEF